MENTTIEVKNRLFLQLKYKMSIKDKLDHINQIFNHITINRIYKPN